MTKGAVIKVRIQPRSASGRAQVDEVTARELQCVSNQQVTMEGRP